MDANQGTPPALPPQRLGGGNETVGEDATGSKVGLLVE
jgi:hypothetical protein